MDTKDLAATYFDAWLAHDFDRLRSVLADDATFTGPMGTADGADACLDGLRGMSTAMEGADVRHVFVDGDDVLTWYDLRMQGAEPCPTANWMHVEDGRISEIRVAFDPRPLTA